ncbi:hypothetical protein AGMMS49975_26140 [Clostridia bacterium]|nr:hypothetical protein AGMMS49975_26140 [Clostridia bacterium]
MVYTAYKDLPIEFEDPKNMKVTIYQSDRINIGESYNLAKKVLSTKGLQLDDVIHEMIFVPEEYFGYEIGKHNHGNTNYTDNDQARAFGKTFYVGDGKSCIIYRQEALLLHIPIWKFLFLHEIGHAILNNRGDELALRAGVGNDMNEQNATNEIIDFLNKDEIITIQQNNPNDFSCFRPIMTKVF